jgi:glycosyltransferase involved in cell wall biosynthesis
MSKILFCTYSHTPWGGIESWLSGITAFAARNGWDVTVGLAHGRIFNDAAAARSRFPGLPVVRIDGRTGTVEGRIRALLRVFDGARPDLVVPVGLGEAFPAVVRRKAAGGSLRLLVPTRSTNPELFRDVKRYAAFIDRLVGVNPLHVNYLLATADLPQARAEAIVNGVELPPGRRARRNPGEPLRIAFVGRLNQEHKRASDLIPFVKHLTRSRVPFRLTIVGSGESEHRLRQALAPHAARGTVEFLGHVPPQRLQLEIFPAQDVLLSFSPSEGCPQGIQQALAHGVVPICSEFLGAHSLGFLRAEETALFFPVGDAAGAARQTERLAHDDSMLEEMSRVGRAEAETFPADGSMRRWLDAFRLTLSQPVRRAAVASSDDVAPNRESISRLERLGVPAGLADALRRLLRRWPRFLDGWDEWPGTVSTVGEAEKADMLAQLHRLDQPQHLPAEPLPHAS